MSSKFYLYRYPIAIGEIGKFNNNKWVGFYDDATSMLLVKCLIMELVTILCCLLLTV